MGIGFVILFWFVIFGVVACVLSVVFGWMAFVTARNHDARMPGWVAAFVLFPFAALVYGVIAFCGYAIWCESARHVDAGIGDTWRVPIAGGYDLCMIDVPDKGFIEVDDKAVVHEVTEIASAGDRIAGLDATGYFEIDAQSGALTRPAKPRLALETVNEYYVAHRWSLADPLAGLLIVAVPIAALLALVRAFGQALPQP